MSNHEVSEWYDLLGTCSGAGITALLFADSYGRPHMWQVLVLLFVGAYLGRHAGNFVGRQLQHLSPRYRIVANVSAALIFLPLYVLGAYMFLALGLATAAFVLMNFPVAAIIMIAIALLRS